MPTMPFDLFTRTARATLRRDGTQEATIVVDRGYRPSRVELLARVPVELRFDLRDEDPCAARLVCELLPCEHHLARGATTSVRFVPQRAGRYAFTCAYGHYLGELVVRDA